MIDKNERNDKLEEQLKKLEGLDDNTQRTVKLTVEQMKYLLNSSENGETAYHKLFQQVIETKEKLQLAVEQEHNKTTIQKYKKNIREHMEKIEGYIDALELASIDFVCRETDIYLKNSESFEDEIAKLSVIENEYEDLKKEYDSLRIKNEETDKELNDTKAAATKLGEENKNQLKTIEGLNSELITVKEKLIAESRKVTDLVEKDNNEIKELQSKLAQETESKINSEQEMFKMKARETSILNERDSFEQRAEDLKEQNKSLTNRLERLEVDRSKKEEIISELSKENSNLDKGIIELKNNIKNVEKDHKIEVKELNNINAALSIETKNNKEEYKKKINEIKVKHEAEITEINNSIVKLLEEKENRESEHNKKIKGMEKIIEQIKIENEKNKTELLFAKENKDKLETSLRDEREKYEKIISEKTKLEVQLENQNAIIEELKKKNRL
jgi:chromosome segregation ATPase